MTKSIQNNYDNFMKKYKNSILLILAFVAGGITTLATTLSFAHGGDANFIHGCVKNSNGSIRIIGPNEACTNNETALDWPKAAKNANFVCVNCQEKDIMHRINKSDLTNTNFNDGILSHSELTNTDISGSTFQYGVLYGVNFSGTDGTDTDFSNANLKGSNMQSSANFSRSKFINANMTFGSFDHSIFIDADFTNADLSRSYLNDSIFTGAIWNNTICPDGTNSNNNGNTCEGHLTP